MRVISKQRFHELFESKGLILDTRYQPPHTLHFPATPDLRCGWDLPASPKDLPRFVSSMFNACEEDESFYLYPRAGAWMCGDTLKIFQMVNVFARLGCSPSADDVLHAGINEIDAVETLFSIALIFGGTVSDDIFAIPSHGQLLLYADHHECIHAEFGDGALMNRFFSQIPEYGAD